MKLFVFRPEGHGDPTFMVVAETEKIAIEKVREYQPSIDLEWYKVESYEPGQVAERSEEHTSELQSL
jgi:hypothetical protein